MGAEPTLEQRLRSCQRSAVHLELRDGYMRSDPRFIAWQNGVRDAPGEVGQLNAAIALRIKGPKHCPATETIRGPVRRSTVPLPSGSAIRWRKTRTGSTGSARRN